MLLQSFPPFWHSCFRATSVLLYKYLSDQACLPTHLTRVKIPPPHLIFKNRRPKTSIVWWASHTRCARFCVPNSTPPGMGLPFLLALALLMISPMGVTFRLPAPLGAGRRWQCGLGGRPQIYSRHVRNMDHFLIQISTWDTIYFTSKLRSMVCTLNRAQTIGIMVMKSVFYPQEMNYLKAICYHDYAI